MWLSGLDISLQTDSIALDSLLDFQSWQMPGLWARSQVQEAITVLSLSFSLPSPLCKKIKSLKKITPLGVGRLFVPLCSHVHHTLDSSRPLSACQTDYWPDSHVFSEPEHLDMALYKSRTNRSLKHLQHKHCYCRTDFASLGF